MDLEESVDLWKRCQNKKKALIPHGVPYEEAHEQAKKIWNDEWVSPLRSERELLEERGLWHVVEKNVQEPEGVNTETKDWLRRARVDFTAVFFRRAESDDSIYPPVQDVTIAKEVSSVGQAIDFSGYIFPGTLSFKNAVFDGWVWFTEAQFNGPTTFRGVQFRNWAGFEWTFFKQRAMMKEVTFADYGVFKNAHFGKDALFDLSEFKLGDFRGAHFDSDASFFAIQCLRGFLVGHYTESNRDTKFRIVPNFTQASFREAPNTTLTIIPNYSENIRRPDDVEARYGALKRLAVQAQDHNAELRFFAEELRATPWWRDVKQPDTVKARYGALKQLAIQTQGHTAKHRDEELRKTPWRSRIDRIIKKIVGHLFGLLSNYGQSILRPIVWWIVSGLGFWLIYNDRASSAAAKGYSCVWSKALSYGPATYVAIVNNIPFVHFFVTSKQEEAIACIGGSPDAFWPGLCLLLLLQNLIATLLVFLFLLALRNYFRIR